MGSWMGTLWSVVMYFYNFDNVDIITSTWWSSSNFKGKYLFNFYLFWLVLRKLSAILWGFSKESPSKKVSDSNTMSDLPPGSCGNTKVAELNCLVLSDFEPWYNSMPSLYKLWGILLISWSNSSSKFKVAFQLSCVTAIPYFHFI